jgi:hypothetical protein
MHQTLDQFAIGHVTQRQLDALGKVLDMAGREVIEHPDRIAALEQRVANVRADESAAPGDQIVRHCVPPQCFRDQCELRGNSPATPAWLCRSACFQ